MIFLIRFKCLRAVIPALLLAATLPAGAQDLGMQVIGDNDEAFGLLIADWMDDEQSRLFAPGFLEEPPTALDPWLLDTQLQAREAVGPAPQVATVPR